MPTSTIPVIQAPPPDELDVATINKALTMGGVQPIAAPAPQGGGQGGGVPLVQNPVNLQAQQANTPKQGSGMDWTAFSAGMGNMEGPTLPEPGYNSDMNQMRAYDRAQMDKERRGNGAEHAGLIMSLMGSFMGMGGGAAGGLGGGKK